MQTLADGREPAKSWKVVYMKEVRLNIADESCQTIVNVLLLCKGVDVVSIDEEELSTDEQVAACVAKAIVTVRRNNGGMSACDFTMIYAAMNQYVIDDIEGFRSPRAYLDYLRLAGVGDLPHRATIAKYNSMVEGVFPDWEFSDTEEPHEILRRINIVKQFNSAFNSAKRALCD